MVHRQCTKCSVRGGNYGDLWGRGAQREGVRLFDGKQLRIKCGRRGNTLQDTGEKSEGEENGGDIRRSYGLRFWVYKEKREGVLAISVGLWGKFGNSGGRRWVESKGLSTPRKSGER